MSLSVLLLMVGSALFFHHAFYNIYALTCQQVRPIYPVLGGVSGAVVCYCMPQMEAYWWLPLLLDVGCVPCQLRALLCCRAKVVLPNSPLEKSAAGCLLGMAVGDALGLACEGLSKTRQHKMFPHLDRYGLLLGKGMCSDDTEHACMTAQALLLASGDERRFAALLGYKLRWWFAALPAGIGLATLRACVKLWLGFPASHSGVASAGNGPAMRAPIIGVLYGADPEKMRQLVNASSHVTHRDLRAEQGALAIALAAYLSSQQQNVTPEQYGAALAELLGETSETLQRVQQVISSLQQGQNSSDFATSIGCEQQVSGYILHTLPMVLHVWLRHQRDYTGGINEMIRLGGDTDTCAAILGGIIGARVGQTGIATHLLDNLIEWPRHPAFVNALGIRVAQAVEQQTAKPELAVFLPALLLRNAVFMLIVLLHGFRRLLPPY